MIGVAEIVRTLKLERHPEGGYYKQTYKASDTIKLPEKFGDESRSSATSIFYLLESGDFSAFHRIKSDEQWYYHQGKNLSIHVLKKDWDFSTITLGLENPHAVIPAGAWFSAEVNEDDAFVLVSCVVSPGFEFKDFELADRAELIEAYPSHAELISRLTRVDMTEAAAASEAEVLARGLRK